MRYDDDLEGEDELVFQDLTPEKPINRWQKGILHLQNNWPPRWNHRHRLILLALLSSILICLLILVFIHTSDQSSGVVEIKTTGSFVVTPITTDVTQALPYKNVIYIILTPELSHEGTLEAINAQTGKLVWSDTRHKAIGIKLINDILYVQNDLNIEVLNANTRTLLWEKQTSSDNWQIDQGTLFIDTQGFVQALNLSTGQQLWRIDQIASNWQVEQGIFYTSPSTGSGSGLTAIDAKSRKFLWYIANADQDWVIDNNTLYLQNDETSNIKAIDDRTGNIRWQINLQSKHIKLSARNGFLFLSDVQTGQVETINGQTGRLLWKEQGNLSFLADNPNLVVISSQQKNETDIIRTADGTILHRFSRTDELLSIENGVAFFIYFPQSDNTQNVSNNFFTISVEAVLISTGATIWSGQARGEFPLLQNNTIGIIPINDNSLLLLRASTGQTLWQFKFDAAGH
jgi:outer membrane protein assembly factor BamB